MASSKAEVVTCMAIVAILLLLLMIVRRVASAILVLDGVGCMRLCVRAPLGHRRNSGVLYPARPDMSIPGRPVPACGALSERGCTYALQYFFKFVVCCYCVCACCFSLLSCCVCVMLCRFCPCCFAFGHVSPFFFFFFLFVFLASEPLLLLPLLMS